MRDICAKYLWLLTCAAIFLTASISPSKADELDESISFDVPAQSLEKALLEVSKQANFQIVIAAGSVPPRNVPRLAGRMTVKEALDRMLEGTELAYKQVGERTLTVVTGVVAPARSSVHGTSAYIHLAQSQNHGVSAPGAADSSTASSRLEKGEAQKLVGLEEIVVTGSHIRGTTSAGSKVTVIGRDYIERSGHATVQAVLKTLPQVFGGGVSEDFTTEQNFTDATAVNLRGLGADSTLVLIDGRRQPVGGVNGTFVDISSIPAAAIERIEVLPDGASAVYGSDAIGGVVNIVLREDFQGAETNLRLGTLGGDAEERQISQLFGMQWNRGHALLGYQYYDREALLRVDRPYAADTDQRRSGGTNFSLFTSSPGNILHPVTRQPAYAIPAGQDGRSLTSADLLPGVTNFQNGALGSDLLGEQTMHSAFVNGAFDLSENVELFVDGRYSKRDLAKHVGGHARTLVVPSTNPFYVNPFGTSSVRVAYNFLNDFGPVANEAETETFASTLGATLGLGERWRMTIAGSYGEEQTRSTIFNQADSAALTAALADGNPATAFNPFGDGGDNNPATLDAIHLVQREGADSDIWTAGLVADGRLLSLPGGALRLAIGADFRQEGLVAGVATQTDLSREVYAGFAELAVPIVGPDNALTGLRGLDLSLAGRYEHYSDFGSTFNPRFGINWQPVSALSVRGSWGTSFKAPSLIELNETVAGNFDQLFALRDPRSSTGQSLSLVRFGNNTALQEETATIWTAGLDVSLPTRPDFALSLTYFNIDFEDRIARGGPSPNFLDILFFEDRWSALIVRNPTASEVAAICSGRRFLGAPSDCTTTPPAAIVDFRLRNLSIVEVRGIDLDLRHAIHTDRGSFRFGLTGTYFLDFAQALNENSPLTSTLDTLNNPVALGLRGALSWARGGWGVHATVNYSDQYRDTASQPNRDIASWSTLDVGASYRFDAGAGWLADTFVGLNAINVFDTEPPFANVSLGYDAANADPLGRTLSVQISKVW